MRMKTARRLLLASVILLAARTSTGGETDEAAIEKEITRLALARQHTFDDLARLALLNSKLHDDRVGAKWLAAAAAARPDRAFTSQRSPFVYVRAWTKEIPRGSAYVSVQKTGDGAFYAAYSSPSRMHMSGVDRIDPLTAEIRRIPIHEEKAAYSSAVAVDYENNFHLANNGITFSFAPDGTYLGQVVNYFRHKRSRCGTLHCSVGGGEFVQTDYYRFVGRLNSLASTTAYTMLQLARSSAIADMDADKDQNVVLAVIGDNRIIMLDRNLNERCRLGGTGTGRGRWLGLTRLAVGNSVMAAADTVLRRVQLFDRNGAWLMDIPAAPYSLSVNDRGTILALEGNSIVCYARFFKDDYRPRGEFASYLQAVKLLEQSRTDEARALLEALADGTDQNLAQVARSLLTHHTLALARHYEAPRFLTKEEAERLIGRKVNKLFLDPYGNAQWATLPDGFVVRIDEFERLRDFRLFTALHGLDGKLNVSAMRLYPNACYAATNHGICRYNRADGDWQFLPGVETLDEAAAAEQEPHSLRQGRSLH